MADIVATIAILFGTKEHLLGSDLTDLFWIQLDAVVSAALVDNLNMSNLVPHDVISDLRVVAVL